MKCRSCHYDNPGGMRFCGMCGHPLGGPPAAGGGRAPDGYTPPHLYHTVLRSPHAVSGELKRVAVLFADVAGFTAMSESLHPETVHLIMDGCFDILVDVVHGVGGTINQYTGDGIMALFGAPTALEDYVARACAAALDIQARLAGYRETMAARHGVDFRMRIGVHVGRVMVGAIGHRLRRDYTAMGDTANMAARLQASAAPGHIHVSAQVTEAVGDRFVLEDAGTRWLKGKSRPQRIYRLIGAAEGGRTCCGIETTALPLVGRDRELAQLAAAWRRVGKGRPQSLSVVGPAGIGKKRLISHFLSGTVADAAFAVTGRCQSFGRTTPLEPLLGMMTRHLVAEVHKASSESAAAAAVVDAVTGLRAVLDGIHHRMAHLETDLEGRRHQLFTALYRLLGAACRIRPVVIALANCQWLDDHSREFLCGLPEALGMAPVLVLCSGQPERRDDAACAVGEAVHVAPLDDGAALQLFTAALGVRRVAASLERVALERAGGNPLFLSELAAALRRGGHLSITDGRAALSTPADDLALPNGIYDVLAARLDALPDTDKRLLQAAAVMGAEFSAEVVAAVADTAIDVPGGLGNLASGGLIQPVGEVNGGRYRFRQQMMRDVAYDMMLRSRRQQIHRRIGETLERMHRDRLSDIVGQLAYHFYMAARWPKALAYNLEAGHRARHMFACHAALVCFERAAAVLRVHRPADAAVMLGDVLHWKGLMHHCTGQFPEALAAFTAMLDEARRTGSEAMAVEARFRMGWTGFFLHRPRLAFRHLSAARKRAQQLHLADILLKATSFLGALHLMTGDMENARRLLVDAMDQSDDVSGLEARAWTLASLVKHYNWSGAFGDALAAADELAAANRSLQSRYFTHYLTFHKGLILGALGRWPEAKALLVEGIRQLDQGDDRFWKPRMRNTLAWILAMAGHPRRALAMNREALAEAVESGDPETIANARINIAENLLQMGDVPGACRQIEDTWRRIRHRGRVYAGWRFKTRARLVLARCRMASGSRSSALNAVNDALGTAIGKGARKHESQALAIKADLLAETRPAMAQRCRERAAALAARMQIPWLTADAKGTRGGTTAAR